MRDLSPTKSAMPETTMPPRELVYELLDKARLSINKAAQVGADRSAWVEYWQVEVLYATALQQMLREQFAQARTLAIEVDQEARQLEQNIIDQMNHTRESISILLEKFSTRMGKLRESYHVEQEKLPASRVSRCNQFFYEARQSFNRALGAFVSKDFVQSEKYLAEARSHLDTVENLLHQRYESSDDGPAS